MKGLRKARKRSDEGKMSGYRDDEGVKRGKGEVW